MIRDWAALDKARCAQAITRRVSALAALHHSRLPHRQGQILALEALAFSADDIAALLGLKRASVDNSLYAARRSLFAGIREPGVPVELPQTRAVSDAWVWLHQRCCMSSAIEAAVRELPAARERYRALEGHSATTVSAEAGLFLALIAAGHELSELPGITGLSLATIKRRATSFELRVCPGGTLPSESGTTAAAWFHGQCCALLPREMVEAQLAQGRATAPARVPARRKPSTLAAIIRRARMAPVVVALLVNAAATSVLGLRRSRPQREQPAASRLWDEHTDERP